MFRYLYNARKSIFRLDLNKIYVLMCNYIQHFNRLQAKWLVEVNIHREIIMFSYIDFSFKLNNYKLLSISNLLTIRKLLLLSRQKVLIFVFVYTRNMYYVSWSSWYYK